VIRQDSKGRLPEPANEAIMFDRFLASVKSSTDTIQSLPHFLAEVVAIACFTVKKVYKIVNCVHIIDRSSREDDADE
jgi:hypothetical protein